MSKIKLVIGLLVYLFIGLFSANSAMAAGFVSIQSLPAYINYNNFKLSCTASGNSAQFSVSKNGGSFVDFGGSINLTTSQCLVQVTSAQFDGETSYTFKVTIDGADSATTITNYDTSGPSPVSGYRKERINDGKYKLSWRTPDNSDFDKVIIYRGETFDFSADSSHEIARVNGSPSSDMTYDDSFSPDANKNYFYDIRAIDRAGNSSSLTGDGSTSSTTVTNPAASGNSGAIGRLQLPNGGTTGGSVLGSNTSPTPSSTPLAASTINSETSPTSVASTGNWLMTHKKIALGVLLLAAAAAYGFYTWKNRK